MANALILALATNPSTVTASVDAVKKDFGLAIDKVITISRRLPTVVTQDRRGRDVPGGCLNLLRKEFREFYDWEIELSAFYLERKKIESPKDVEEFWGLCAQKIRSEAQAGNNVFVSLGREDIALDIILSNVAPLFGATRLVMLSGPPKERQSNSAMVGSGGEWIRYKLTTLRTLQGYPVGHAVRNKILHPDLGTLELPLFRLHSIMEKMVTNEDFSVAENYILHRDGGFQAPKGWELSCPTR